MGEGEGGEGKETRSAQLVNHPDIRTYVTHKRPPYSYGRTACDVGTLLVHIQHVRMYVCTYVRTYMYYM